MKKPKMNPPFGGYVYWMIVLTHDIREPWMLTSVRCGYISLS